MHELKRLSYCFTTNALVMINILNEFFIFQHFSGRRRNCYSIAIKAVHRALQFATIGRAVRKTDMISVSNNLILIM